MKNKKAIIFLICIIVILVFLSLPLVIKASKDLKWKEVEVDPNGINIIIYNASTEKGTGIELSDEKNYVAPEIEQKDDSITPYSSQETTEEEKALYDKWKKESELSIKRGEIVENLLEKNYPNENNLIKQKVNAKKKDGEITLQLTSEDIERAKLIVMLYKEKKLNKEEKEACKQSLSNYYKRPYDKVKIDDELKKEIEKIIK